MLEKIKKTLVVVLALVIIMLSVLSLYAYNKYKKDNKALLRKEIEEKISMKNIDIPDNSKRLVFEATKNGKPVFSEVVYDGLTKQEIINQINKSLSSSLTETADIFVNKSMDYGMDPYLVVAISLLETGCKWGCSYLTKECNNVGGMKGTPVCEGTNGFRSFDTLEEGIDEFISNIYYNYYQKGLVTADEMAYKYANKSTTWAGKVNNYINEIKSK